MPWRKHDDIEDTFYHCEDSGPCVLEVSVEREGSRVSEGEGYYTSYAEDSWHYVAGTVTLSWNDGNSYLDLDIETPVDDLLIEWLDYAWGVDVYAPEN